MWCMILKRFYYGRISGGYDYEGRGDLSLFGFGKRMFYLKRRLCDEEIMLESL